MPSRGRNILVGCAGFSGTQAEYYRQFDCVEIDSSFYNLPQVRTAARWRDQAPPEFVFTMKAWQVITHRATSPTYRRTRLEPADREHCGSFGFNPTIRWAWDRTMAVATALGVRMVLFQSPAGFRPNRENLGRLRMFFERCKRGKFELGWEPRGAAWDAGQIDELARELDLVPVLDPFAAGDRRTGRRRLRYSRLPGIGGRSYRYTDVELERVAGWCRQPGARQTICVFSNLAKAVDAKRLERKLNRRLATSG